jgi:hypothetical protein
MYKDFSECPHCDENDRRTSITPLSWMAPFINRSDGSSFHLLLADMPIKYSPGRKDIPSECLGAGFWYVHDKLAPSPATVSVLLTRPPQYFASLEHQLREIADLLAELLLVGRPLCPQYEFDGVQLCEMALAYQG